LSYAISLEYKCPFGEEIDNSNVFINTVNAYEGLYKQIATPSNIREADAIRNSVTMCWEDQITGMHIVMTYRNGDIAKARFPEITIYIQGEI